MPLLKPQEYMNSLFEEDCLSLMKKLPDQSVDMVLCDLPYGTTQNQWDSVIDLPKLWALYKRVVKPNGAIVLTSQGLFTARLIMSNPEMFKYKYIWVKTKPTNFLNAKKQPLRKHEDVCVFYTKQPRYNPQFSVGKPYSKGVRKNQKTGSYGDFKPVLVESPIGYRYPTDVLPFKTPESENDGKVWHPTQKPVELGRYLIRTFTNPGDVVLDNASGSGSFLVSAVLEARNFIGIEINNKSTLFKESDIDLIEVSRMRIFSALNETRDSKNLTKSGLVREFWGDHVNDKL